MFVFSVCFTVIQEKYIGTANMCIPFRVCVCPDTKLRLTLCDPTEHIPTGSSVHGIFPGKNTGVGCHFLLQGIFLTQGLNMHLLCLLHWQADSLPEPPGKPIIFHTTVIYLHGKKCLLIINQSYLETVILTEIKRQKEKKKTLILGFIRHGSYKADALWLQEDFQIFRPQDEILLLTALCGQVLADHSLVISPTSGPSKAVNRSGSNFWPVLTVANLLC